jgi:flagellar biosynthesis protein FlhF
MLVGMPGAGKTMVAAKIAARGAFTGQKVGVITTDTQRAGGVEQLAAFTRLLKLDLVETEDRATLADGLLTQTGCCQVVIDTAGVNPFSADDVAGLSALLQAGEIEPVLVLPAGGDPQEAGEIGRIFADIGVQRLIVTRLEMTRRLGGLLSAAHTGGLAFADASLTSKVADGLTPVNPVALARILIASKEEDASAPLGVHAASI